MTTPVKHIALILGSLRMGGAERASVNLLNEFVQRGIRCDIVLVNEAGEFLVELHPEINIISLGKSRTLFSGLALCRYLKKIRPQIIIAGQTHVQLMTLWARNRTARHIPVILNEHSTFSANHPLDNWKSNLMRKLVSRWFSSADEITAVSTGVAEDLIKEFPNLQSKVSVVYNPVINESLKAKSLLDVSLPWKKDSEIPFIIAAGRLVPDKDFKLLVEAVALVRKEKRVRLLILGEGEERQSLYNLSQELGFEDDISLYGYSSNPYALMKHASLFVLSSRREGLPMALIEAMACDLPIVSTDCPSGPREILHDGKYGALVPMGEVDSLAKAIFVSLRNQVSFRTSEEAIRPYFASTVCDKYLELMTTLLSNKAGI